MTLKHEFQFTRCKFRTGLEDCMAGNPVVFPLTLTEAFAGSSDMYFVLCFIMSDTMQVNSRMFGISNLFLSEKKKKNLRLHTNNDLNYCLSEIFR